VTEHFLQQLTVQNFRSIRGEVSIPLDAPVILVHGRNGVGKTSLLSAIELALTGDVGSLRRIDTHVSDFLLHKATDKGMVSLSANGRSSQFLLTKDSLTGKPVLDAAEAHFFNERCYLAQWALSKLLEIYQHQEKRNSESALTKFVKELLQLDQYDALIDGLHIGGNVKRLREHAPLYWEAREMLEKTELDIVENLAQQLYLEASMLELRQKLQLPAPADSTPEIVRSHLASLRATYQTQSRAERIALLTQLQHQLTVALAAIERVEGQAGANPMDAEHQVTTSSAAYDEWAATSGAMLDKLITELGQFVSTASTIASGDPAARRILGLKAAIDELAKLDHALALDKAAAARQTELASAIQGGTSRIAALDGQIADVSKSSGSLAEALSAILPHIHTDNCPVCSRNFSEVSKQTLASHVANQVAGLVETAAKLGALTQDKATSVSTVANLQRELSTVSAQVMQPDQRDSIKLRRARLAEIQGGLERLEDEVRRGVNLATQRNIAVQDREVFRTRIESLTAARNTLKYITEALQQPPPADSVLPSQQAYKLKAMLEAAIGTHSTEQAKATTMLDAINELELLMQREARLLESRQNFYNFKKRLEDGKAVSDGHIEIARALSKAAKEKRTGIVRRVFSEDLNAVWRALFVRLAPDEDFVPAFALPDDPAADVEAILETHYRSGGKGGDPRAMLSAGNLNTAALTLFLSLHLSVYPTLRCLVIDDPVQSMDEVHISQFAALLRTLSKEHGRQIVVAVHERSLFDYLALELSPAFPDDRLITVELERAVNGMSSVRWELKTFEKDEAVAA
jgi:exonuclease SbcC